MIDTQLGRRNLPPAQRLAVMDKFKKKIQEQAKEKLVESGKLYGEKHPKNKSLSPNGETLPKIHTDKELTKLEGVGTGTIARFNRVMNSDDKMPNTIYWMLDIQLGRRNLSPIQRIAVAEKSRGIYEKQALINKQNAMSEARRNNKNNNSEQFLPNSVTTVEKVDTTKKLADVAGVGKETYRMGKKILESDNEDVKQVVLSGETSISAGYKELII